MTLAVEVEHESSRAQRYNTRLTAALQTLDPRGFGSPLKTGRYDRDYWTVKRDPIPWGGRPRGMLVLKPGKKPSRALEAIVAKSSEWTLDCAYFVQVAHLYALSQADPAAFDRTWAGKEYWLRYHESSGAGDGYIKYFFRRSGKSAGWTWGGPRIRSAAGRPRRKWTPASAKWTSITVLAAMPRGSRVMWSNLQGSGSWINENTIKVGSDRYRAFGFGDHKKDLTGRQVALLLAAAARGDDQQALIDDASQASQDLRNYTDANVYLKEALSFRRP
jgi:hypothetical protein